MQRRRISVPFKKGDRTIVNGALRTKGRPKQTYMKGIKKDMLMLHVIKKILMLHVIKKMALNIAEWKKRIHVAKPRRLE